MSESEKKIVDSIEEKIKLSARNFFNEHPVLEREDLDTFLDIVGLLDVWNVEEEKNIIWSLFLNHAHDAKIDYYATINALKELLNANYDESTECHEDIVRLSLTIPQKCEILNRVSLNRNLCGKNSSSSKKKFIQKEQEIEKRLENLEIDKLRQLRKIFTLLDLRNRESVFMSEIPPMLHKYKFITLPQDELLYYLKLLSQDTGLSDNNNNLNTKLKINDELLAKTFGIIEHQLLGVNDTACKIEHNRDNFEGYNEMLDDMHNLELELNDYVMILSDMLYSLRSKINNCFMENIDNFDSKDDKAKEICEKSIEAIKNKLSNADLFLMEMSNTCKKKQSKLEILKEIVLKIQANLKLIEDDYRQLFQRYTTSQQVEVDQEMGRLLDENLLLNQIKDQKNLTIEKLKKENSRKEEQILSLSSKYDRVAMNENTLKREIERLEQENKILRNQYSELINDIFQKIFNGQQGENDEITITSGNSETTNKVKRLGLSPSEKETAEKIKQKYLINEDQKKLFSLNYEKLLLYTLNIETYHKSLEDQNRSFQQKVFDLEKELERINIEITNVNSNYYTLKSENAMLQTKIQHLSTDVDLNCIFRPSNCLSQLRYSQMSKILCEDKKVSDSCTKKETYMSLSPSSFTGEEEQLPVFEPKPLPMSNSNSNSNHEGIGMKQDDDITNIRQDIFSAKESISGKNLFGNIFSNIEKESELEFRATVQVHDVKQSISDCLREVELEGNNRGEENESTSKDKTSHIPDPISQARLKANIKYNNQNMLISEEENEDQCEGKTKQSGLTIKPPEISQPHDAKISPQLKSDEARFRKHHHAYNFSCDLNHMSKKEQVSSREHTSHHSRKKTCEDINLVLSPDSQYTCYDFLTLRKNMGVIKMLEENLEDVISFEMFSDTVYIVDNANKKSKNNLFITSNSIYVLNQLDFSCKIKIPRISLNKITISNKNCNLIALHFEKGDDLLIEIFRRMELLYYFRDLYRFKGFGKLRFKFSDHFRIKKGDAYSIILANQVNNLFITPNFENAQKLGYLSKLTEGFFSDTFSEKFVVLTNVGLLYFEDLNKPPKKLIPIIGSDIIKVDDKKYKMKFCFEIKTLNGELNVFSTKTEEDMETWLDEFNDIKKSYAEKIRNLDKAASKK